MQLSTFLKILKFFSPRFYNYYNYTIEQKYNLRSKLGEAENKNKEYASILLLIDSIMKDDKKEFLGLAPNKNKRLTITYIEQDCPSNEFNIIVEEFIGTINKVVYKLQIAFYEESKSIDIIDNHALIYDNKGNGSIGLKALTQLAIKKNYKTISGEISFPDWDHVDKLKHFYEKQNFKVTLNYEEKEGYIRWKNNR